MASVVLVSSNPTNLVLSGAFSLSFTTYTAHCIVPFLAAAVIVYPVLSLLFFRSPDLVPSSIDLDMTEDGDVSETLIDKPGAIFGSILLLITLGVLVGTSTIGVSVWEVTAPPAIIMFLRDIRHDWARRHFLDKGMRRRHSTSPSQEVEITSRTIPEAGEIHPQELQGTSRLQNEEPKSLLWIVRQYYNGASSTFPTVASIVQRLPFPLLPFAFLMFILVQGLSAQGWVDVFSGWWAAWIHKTGVLGAIGGMGFVACMCCNLCGTNIGATILLARVLQLWIANDDGLDPRVRDGAIYALALGSNYGAFTLTFSASLAGLLWRRILWQKGIHVRPRQFLLLNLPIAITAMTTSSGILLAQVYITNRNS